MTTTKLKLLLDNGLDMNHYMVMMWMKQGVKMQELQDNLKVQSWIHTLNRKGYLSDNEITVDGTALLSQIESDKVEEVRAVKVGMSLEELHESLVKHLFSLKKKRQVMGFGNVYFIPSKRDLEDFLGRFRKKYPELWDLQKIEKCLHAHITKCVQKDSFAPAIKYFIIKEGSGSQLAAAMEEYEEVAKENGQYDITDTKSLFG